MKPFIAPHNSPWELLISDPLDIIMSQRASCLLIKEGIIRFPPPYTVPKLHPHNYYKTCQSKHSGDPVGNVQSSEQAVLDHYSWLDSNDPRRDMTDEEILD